MQNLIKVIKNNPAIVILLGIFAYMTIQTSLFSEVSFASGLPPKVQKYLNQTYAGWKPTTIANGCYAEFRKAVVVGDFDGNQEPDYAVKFIHQRKGYIIAFLASGTNYQPYVLINTSASTIKNIGLHIGRKGATNTDEDGKTTRLRNDAPLIGACESEACFYVYRNGRFNCG